MMRLALHPLWEDDDGMLKLELSAQTSRRSLSQDFFAYPSELEEFGLKLQAFPASIRDSVVFEYGPDDPKTNWYSQVRLRAYLYDAGGHAALEFLVHNKLEAPDEAMALFSVKLEAATLNKLGQELATWSRSKDGDFEFEANEA